MQQWNQTLDAAVRTQPFCIGTTCFTRWATSTLLYFKVMNVNGVGKDEVTYHICNFAWRNVFENICMDTFLFLACFSKIYFTILLCFQMQCNCSAAMTSKVWFLKKTNQHKKVGTPRPGIHRLFLSADFYLPSVSSLRLSLPRACRNLDLLLKLPFFFVKTLVSLALFISRPVWTGSEWDKFTRWFIFIATGVVRLI